MTKPSGKEIQELACKIVREHPAGVKNRDVIREILERHPDANPDTVASYVSKLDKDFPESVTKPDKGILAPVDLGPSAGPPTPIAKSAPGKQKEEPYYGPFAEYLVNELDEATAAVSLGGADPMKKWGTPDVVGVYRSSASDIIKFPPEIIAAEIKAEPNAPVVAFGQAVAYRLFASKSYIVMPSDLGEANASRLEALCMLYGIGLVLFGGPPKDPGFTIRVRAQRIAPDMFYVNEFAHHLSKKDSDKFKKLFP